MIGAQSGSTVRSGARREFDAFVLVRPGADKRAVCLRGHRLDFDLYDKLAPYSRRCKLHGTLCLCTWLEGDR